MDPRSNSLADVLRRTAARDGGKVALIAGEVRQTYAELDAEASRVANALAARGVRQGDRVALLARNCREYVVVVFAAAKLGAVLVPVNFMLDRRRRRVRPRAQRGASALIAGEGLADVAEEALGLAGRRPRARCASRSAPERRRVGAVRGARGPRGRVGPRGGGGRRRPGRSSCTRAARSRGPKGAMLTSRSLIAQVREHRSSTARCATTTWRSTRCRSSTARSCTASSSPTSWSARRTSSCPRPSPRRMLAAVERRAARRSSSARRRSGSRSLRSPAFDRARPRLAAQGLLRRVDHAGRGAARARRAPAAGAPLQLLRADRDVAAGHACCARRTRCARPARPGARRSTSRRASSTTRAATSPPGEVGEIVHRSPARDARLLATTRRRRPRASRAAGSTRGDLGTIDEEGYITSSTARRT